MINKVLETVRRHQLFEAGDRIIVALSGGSDSVALLLVLKELTKSLSLHVSAAHVNHLLRGEESDEDERFVCDLCQEIGIPIEVQRVDTRREVRSSGENLQSCARRLRYDFFGQLALSPKHKVTTGHTLNDQVETFLMRLVRGAGSTGLSGISTLVRSSNLNTGSQTGTTMIVRPLLEVSRVDILAYLKENKQDYREDRSNRDLSYDRNWVRHELLPLLQNKLNPAIVETLHRSSQLFKEIDDYLVLHGRKAFEQCLVQQEGEIRIQIEELETFPSIIQKQVLRQGVMSTKGDLRGITFKHIAAVAELCTSGSGREVHLPGGLRVQREFEELRFTQESFSSAFWYQLSVPGKVRIKEAEKSIMVRKVDKVEDKGIFVRWETDSLIVRNRRPGDEYRTSSRSGSKKLKELLQSKRISKSRRDKLLILEGNNQIMWVEGFPPHPDHRISSDDSVAIEIVVQSDTIDHVG
ncbi:MAG: tRNA lysidine(34) synthetase TilS [Acidobacteriota bacterium]|nr:tRNA lysidine(34) synthetase TilS [Acidobacteriota bacterium]